MRTPVLVMKHLADRAAVIRAAWRTVLTHVCEGYRRAIAGFPAMTRT